MRQPSCLDRRLLTLAVVLAVSAAAGCSSGNEDLKKQIRALETRVTSLRADADRLEERLEAVELNATVAARASRPREKAEGEERPRLKVIRLAPDQDAPAEQAPPPMEPAEDPGGPRPMIRGKGEDVTKTGARLEWRRSGLVGKSARLPKERRVAAAARLSPPFPGVAATRRVPVEEGS